MVTVENDKPTTDALPTGNPPPRPPPPPPAIMQGPSSNKPPKYYTISEAIDAMGYGKFQIYLSLAAGLAFLSDAMEMMILSVLAPALECQASWNVTKNSIASLSSSVFLAMMLTSPIWGFIADTYGRRSSLMISSVLLILFGLLTAVSPSFDWLLGMRFLCGCCISCMPQCITLLLEYLPRFLLSLLY